MKFDLKKEFENKKQQDKTFLTRVAKEAGFSNTSTLSKWSSNPKKEADSFNGLITIINHTFPETEEYEVMAAYAKTLDFNRKTARYILEYAKINKLDDLFNFMLEKLENTSNAESKEWAKLYKLDQDAAKGNIDLIESIQEASQPVCSPEMKVFAKLIQIYGYYEMKNYSIMTEIASTLHKSLEEIKDEYIRNSYTVRLNIALLCVYLHQGEIDKLRDLGMSTLEKTQKGSLIALTNMQIGHSYTFESFQKAYDHLNAALVIAEGLNDEFVTREVKKSLNYVCNYWGVTPEHLDRNSANYGDINEVVFSYIRSGQTELAQQMIEELKIEDMNNNEKGFYFFLKGLLSNNKEDYYTSIKYMKVTGDKFYRKGALIELQKLGENPFLLEALAE